MFTFNNGLIHNRICPLLQDEQFAEVTLQTNEKNKKLEKELGKDIHNFKVMYIHTDIHEDMDTRMHISTPLKCTQTCTYIHTYIRAYVCTYARTHARTTAHKYKTLRSRHYLS